MSHKIALSSGHSRKATGAYRFNTREWTLNCELLEECQRVFPLVLPPTGVSLYIADHNAEDLGYPGHIVRTYRNINQEGCVCAIELHHNSVLNPEVKGCEILYHDDSFTGLTLAKEIARLVKLFQPKVSILPFKRVRGFQAGFLAKTKCPAIFMEPGYMSNYEDFFFVQERKEDFAFAIIEGVVNWVRKAYPYLWDMSVSSVGT